VLERIRGYVDGLVEDLDPDGVRTAADELAAVCRALASFEQLAAVLADPGVASHARRAVVAELFASQLSAPSLELIDYTIEVARAAELAEDLAWLAERLAAAANNLRAVGPNTLSRRAAEERLDGYAARALLPVRGRDALGEVEDELFRFGRIVAGSPELADVLGGRDRSAEARAGLVRSLLAGRADEATVRLAAYVATVGRPRDYLDLLDAVVARVGLETRRRMAEVRAAVGLSDEQRVRLAAALGRITGQQVEVTVRVDPSVLGGFVATMGDTVVDGSVRHRLELLKDRLAPSEASVSNEGAV